LAGPSCPHKSPNYFVNHSITLRALAHLEKAVKKPSHTIILTLALAAAAMNASAETRLKADPEVEKPCVAAALAQQLELQLQPLRMQTDRLLLALIDDKQTATTPKTMYFLGRNMTVLEGLRRIEYTPDVMCPVEIDRLSRASQMVVRTYAALLDGNSEIDIEKLTNKAALDALPQLLVQAQALEKTVGLIADSFQQREY